MKGKIYICTTIGERLNEVLKIVGDTLVEVCKPVIDHDVVVIINATEEQWNSIKPKLAASR